MMGAKQRPHIALAENVDDLVDGGEGGRTPSTPSIAWLDAKAKAAKTPKAAKATKATRPPSLESTNHHRDTVSPRVSQER
eukprot:1196404-Prorocentrum_minimum.AAC.2